MKESPARNVILPSKNATDITERKYMTESELPIFLRVFEDYSPLNTIIKLLLFTGMRSGECLRLQWEDVDFKKKIITVHHTLSDVGGRHFLATPKTKGSRRFISMSDTVAEIQKVHKKYQLELQIAQAENFLHPEMVFTSDIGNYKDRSCLNIPVRRSRRGVKCSRLLIA